METNFLVSMAGPQKRARTDARGARNRTRKIRIRRDTKCYGYRGPNPEKYPMCVAVVVDEMNKA